MAGRQTKQDMDERQLHHWKLLEAFQQRLEPVLAKRDQTATELDPRRQLQPGGYLSMMLFALLNPVIKSTRVLCAASGSGRMSATGRANGTWGFRFGDRCPASLR